MFREDRFDVSVFVSVLGLLVRGVVAFSTSESLGLEADLLFTFS